MSHPDPIYYSKNGRLGKAHGSLDAEIMDVWCRVVGVSAFGEISGGAIILKAWQVHAELQVTTLPPLPPESRSYRFRETDSLLDSLPQGEIVLRLSGSTAGTSCKFQTDADVILDYPVVAHAGHNSLKHLQPARRPEEVHLTGVVCGVVTLIRITDDKFLILRESQQEVRAFERLGLVNLAVEMTEHERKRRGFLEMLHAASSLSEIKII